MAFTAGFWGDPHILTLDGVTYTYNGKGEYWLQKPSSDAGVKMQARLAEPWDSDGNVLNGTVFVAIALEVENTRVHVELSVDRSGDFTIRSIRLHVVSDNLLLIIKSLIILIIVMDLNFFLHIVFSCLSYQQHLRKLIIVCQ